CWKLKSGDSVCVGAPKGVTVTRSHSSTTSRPTPTPSSASSNPDHQTTTSVAPPVTTAQPPTPGLSSEEQATLDRHNYYRAQYGIPPLTWDFNLASFSQGFIINHLQANGQCDLYHSGTPNVGENAFEAATPSVGVADSMPAMFMAVDSWMTEDPYQTGNHASQTLWKGSKTVGCGRGVQGCAW
ncbi:hypothetical protein HDU76_009818, partial [Blyttiomyces sp. JEL0837]